MPKEEYTYDNGIVTDVTFFDGNEDELIIQIPEDDNELADENSLVIGGITVNKETIFLIGTMLVNYAKTGILVRPESCGANSTESVKSNGH